MVQLTAGEIDELRRQADQMTARFLRWKLPPDFNPDGGIEYRPLNGFEPTGTNLMTYTQARAMVEYMLGLSDDN